MQTRRTRGTILTRLFTMTLIGTLAVATGARAQTAKTTDLVDEAFDTTWEQLVVDPEDTALDDYGLRIVNGRTTLDHPEVGVLLRGPDLASAQGTCTGTLVGCDAFVTAAHCVKKPGPYFLFFQHAGFFATEPPLSHPAYAKSTADIAVLRLTTPVTAIHPASPPTGTPVKAGGQGFIVGFGRAGGKAHDFGLKRVGEITVAPCDPEKTTDEVSICWNFTDAEKARGKHSTTCHGDSGGPFFAPEYRNTVLAGVTSGGTSENCLPDDHAFDTRVSTYRPWLEKVLADAMSRQVCGEFQGVGSTGSPYFGTLAKAEAPGARNHHRLTLGPQVERLRLAVNGWGRHAKSLTFEVQHRGQSVPCRVEQADTFAFCDIEKPEAGEWTISAGIDEALYPDMPAKAIYQIVATTLRSETTPVASGAHSP